MIAHSLQEAIGVFEVLPLKEETLRSYYVERDDNPLNQMETLLVQSSRVGSQPKVLFIGHRGSGKSTELNKLGEGLDEKFFVISFTVERQLSEFRASHVDFLLSLGTNVFDAAAHGGVKLKKGRRDALYDALAPVYREVTRQKKLPQVDLEVLIASIKDVLPIGLGEEVTKKIEVPPTIQQLHRCVNEILLDIRASSGKPVLLIIDGIDKLAFEPVKQIYQHNELLLSLACSVVFTCPISLALSSEMGQVVRNFELPFNLPNIKTRTREGDPYERGLEKLQEIIAKRMDLSLIEPEALDLVVEKSGGMVRDLIALMGRSRLLAVNEDKSVIDTEAVNGAINDLSISYTRFLQRPHIEALRLIHESKSIADVTDDKIRTDLIRSVSVIEYRNGRDVWYDVHPVVAQLLELE